MKRLLFASLVVVCTVACGGSTPTAPAPVVAPPQPLCQQNNTGELVLINSAANLLPRDVYLDGALIGTLPYGNQTARDISAGVAHPVQFRSVGGAVLVSSASPNVIRCTSSTLTNTF